MIYESAAHIKDWLQKLSPHVFDAASEKEEWRAFRVSAIGWPSKKKYRVFTTPKNIEGEVAAREWYENAKIYTAYLSGYAEASAILIGTLMGSTIGALLGVLAQAFNTSGTKVQLLVPGFIIVAILAFGSLVLLKGLTRIRTDLYPIWQLRTQMYAEKLEQFDIQSSPDVIIKIGWWTSRKKLSKIYQFIRE